MTANELRIGNWIYLPSKTKQYQISSGHDIEEIEGSGDCEPLQLTEEWLLKFGFDKKEDYLYMLEKGFVYNKDDVNVLLFNGEFSYGTLIYDGGTSEDWEFGIDIKSVHHLQNLYYALTGIELEIK